ncbi:MAG: 3-phosphoshikimate 1-carboxyvinyltransferase [Lewinellaceae bacterium]|nr:3-phosphoshikimate 1-carboxyvinyltransferase [Lewinellaceae bacterium]
MEIIRLSKPDRTLQGTIALDGSKSLSNRALVILALSGADPGQWLSGLSGSKDTQTLLQLLQNPSARYDAGDAGTTFRFLTAYLALQPGAHELTGSARMRERPIGALVEALRSLGARIDYLGQLGYPPLRIDPPNFSTKKMQTVRIDASVSSQFLSALLLIGPNLPGGLELIPEGQLVSRPYLEMTMQMMRFFGADTQWQGARIRVAPGQYVPRALRIEADWSAASYWYALAAFAETVNLRLEGLLSDSWQGDRVIRELMKDFGVASRAFGPTSILTPNGDGSRTKRTVDFRNCPDIAQTMAVVYAGLGIPAVFTGLETLAIKETDRTSALSVELAKIGVHFGPETPGGDRYVLQGKAHWDTPPRFATYGDHRMAMAFSTLAMLGPVEIENPAVVAKSYPAFWEHLAQVGFSIEKYTAP